MRLTRQTLSITLLMLATAASMSLPVHAHLMVAQHGTLNIAQNGVFMVLSLPISAFQGVDENGDGKVTMLEFNNHRTAIVESVRQNVTLADKEGSRLLHGIMLSPVAQHDADNEALSAQEKAISQLTVLGKFTLVDPDTALSFHAGLYGEHTEEAQLEITATRKTDNQEHVFQLTPKASTMTLFPS